MQDVKIRNSTRNYYCNYISKYTSEKTRDKMIKIEINEVDYEDSISFCNVELNLVSQCVLNVNIVV